MSRSPVRRLLTVSAALVVALVVAIIAGLPVYVFPQTDPPGHSDVVYVIGPPTKARMALADEMLDSGLADTLLISVNDPDDSDLCRPRPTVTVYCARPDPFTTQGEARWLRDMATDHHWDSATVITFTPHITRARLLMERCFPGEVRMLADAAPLHLGDWVYSYVYQTGAFVKVALNPGC